MLMQKLGNVCSNWGMRVVKVDILEIEPSKTIQEAMHKQIRAERERRAATTTADGFRERLKTEGDRMSCVHLLYCELVSYAVSAQPRASPSR